MTTVTGPYTTYVLTGIALDRPASPPPWASGSVWVFYVASDTGAVTTWNGTAWVSFGGGGAGGDGPISLHTLCGGL